MSKCLDVRNVKNGDAQKSENVQKRGTEIARNILCNYLVISVLRRCYFWYAKALPLRAKAALLHAKALLLQLEIQPWFLRKMPNVKIYDEMAENITCIWVLKHENCFIDACRIQEKNKFFA